MTDEQIALARRAVACKGWRWMPGMLTSDGGRVRAISPSRIVWDYLNNFGSDHASTRTESVNALPDLTDPATLGCLLALVREACGDPGMFVRPRGSKMRPDWAVFTGANSDIVCAALSEAEALVAALEAAP